MRLLAVQIEMSMMDVQKYNHDGRLYDGHLHWHNRNGRQDSSNQPVRPTAAKQFIEMAVMAI